MLRVSDSSYESLSDFLCRVWKTRLALFIGAIIGGICGVALLFLLQPHYEARMIIAPALLQDAGESLMHFETGNERAGRLSGADHISADYIKFEQILREGTVSGILGHYEGVLAKISADHFFRFQPDTEIAPEMVSAYLQRHVKIQPIGSTPSRIITYSHPDPQFAARLLKHLHTIADETIRQKSAAETDERIAWLQKELMRSANPDHRNALTGLLLAQERRRMLVSMDQPFAAELVEPPAIPAKPDWPCRPLIIISGIFAGMFVAFTIASLRHKA